MKEELGLFFGKDRPDPRSAWRLYEEGLAFNRAVNLNDTVRVNENFYIGKQWEGVESNGLPTPQFNFLKRVVGFIVATITTDNIKVTASALSSTPNTDRLIEPVRIVNEEFDTLMEQNKIPALLRDFARNAAVDGDGCLYSWWDPEAETGQDCRGTIRTEVIENTRVFFGNPNDRRVQSQPWIIISSREIVRQLRKRARENGFDNWASIGPDEDERDIDAAKRTDDKATVLLLLWKDEESGRVWAFETTRGCPLRKCWDTGLRLYPICWLNWDYIQDSYHGQAMLTGLIPNQIFVNKIWAASMLSFLKTAYPKVIYDRTRIKNWDNRVGAAIGIAGGDVNTVARIMDPAAISPQIGQFIQMAVEQTEQALGATSVALGDTRPDNTSAILALQRASAVPTELTKQNLYQCVEDMFRIYMEFMGEYYGVRRVDREQTEDAAGGPAGEFPPGGAGEPGTVDFDFSSLKKHPLQLKLDVGASSYYSEIASMQTLDNLLQSGQISMVQYLERIPDGYIPARRALLAEMKAAEKPAEPEGMAGPGEGDLMAQLMGSAPPPAGPAEPMDGLESLQQKALQGGPVPQIL